MYDIIMDENTVALRNYMIKMLRRYMMEMDLMKNIVIQNAFAFESNKDILEQYDRVKKELKAVLDYNFYDEEVKAVEALELE